MDIKNIKHGDDLNSKSCFNSGSSSKNNDIEEIQFVNVKKLANDFVDSVNKNNKSDDIKFINYRELADKLIDSYKKEKENQKDKAVDLYSNLIQAYVPETSVGKKFKKDFLTLFSSVSASDFVLRGMDLNKYNFVKSVSLSLDASYHIDMSKKEYMEKRDKLVVASMDKGEPGQVEIDSNGVKKYKDYYFVDRGLGIHTAVDYISKRVYPNGNVKFFDAEEGVHKFYELNANSYSETVKKKNDDSLLVRTHFSDGFMSETIISDSDVVENYIFNPYGHGIGYRSYTKANKLLLEKIDVNLSCKFTMVYDEYNRVDAYLQSDDSNFVKFSAARYEIDESGKFNFYDVRADGKEWLKYSFVSDLKTGTMTEYEYDIHGKIANSSTID